VTVLTFSNGVDVWLKPSDFRADQVVFSSYARGGISTAPPDQYFNASLASSIVGIGGIGGLTPVDLGKLLAGQDCRRVGLHLDPTRTASPESATPKDLETALQMAYLHFTAPNRDPGALDLMKRRLEASLANQSQSPGACFGERVRAINTVNHYTSKPIRIEDVAKLDAQAMWTFYDERFSNAANFTFFFVGNFTVDEITPLLAPTRVAAVEGRARFDGRRRAPAVPQRCAARNRDQGAGAAGADRHHVLLGHRARRERRRRASAPRRTSSRTSCATSCASSSGGTYSVSVGYSDTSPQPGYGTTTVQFGSSPENVEKLSAAVMTELDRLRRDGPTRRTCRSSRKPTRTTSRRRCGRTLLAERAAVVAHPRARSEDDSAPLRAHRRAHRRERPRSDAEVPAGRSLHRRHVDARSGRRERSRGGQSVQAGQKTRLYVRTAILVCFDSF
jgi:zinc protease